MLITLIIEAHTPHNNINNNPKRVISPFAKEAKVYSWASYLNLRTETFSTILLPDYYPSEDDAFVYRGKRIQGTWLKVDYEGLEGYVFDGYLSTFSTYQRGFVDENWEILKNYVEEMYPESSGQLFDEDYHSNDFTSPDGLVKYKTESTDYAYTQTIEFANMDLDEGVVIATKLFDILGVESNRKGKIQLLIESGQEGSLEVIEKDGAVQLVLRFWDGC